MMFIKWCGSLGKLVLYLDFIKLFHNKTIGIQYYRFCLIEAETMEEFSLLLFHLVDASF